MLRKIVLAIAAVIAAIVLYASTRPSHFEYSRATTVSASAAAIYALVNDFSKWPSWSPWEKYDPNMKKATSPNPIGVGAWSTWSGNSQAGEGKSEIVQSVTNELIMIRLDMLKPMKATNAVEFRFEPFGQDTKVTWTMRGENNLIGKIFSVFVDCEKMVGKDFEEGLSNLKRLAEKKS